MANRNVIYSVLSYWSKFLFISRNAPAYKSTKKLSPEKRNFLKLKMPFTPVIPGQNQMRPTVGLI